MSSGGAVVGQFQDRSARVYDPTISYRPGFDADNFETLKWVVMRVSSAVGAFTAADVVREAISADTADSVADILQILEDLTDLEVLRSIAGTPPRWTVT